MREVAGKQGKTECVCVYVCMYVCMYVCVYLFDDLGNFVHARYRTNLELSFAMCSVYME